MKWTLDQRETRVTGGNVNQESGEWWNGLTGMCSIHIVYTRYWKQVDWYHRCLGMKIGIRGMGEGGGVYQESVWNTHSCMYWILEWHKCRNLQSEVWKWRWESEESGMRIRKASGIHMYNVHVHACTRYWNDTNTGIFRVKSRNGERDSEESGMWIRGHARITILESD